MRREPEWLFGDEYDGPFPWITATAVVAWGALLLVGVNMNRASALAIGVCLVAALPILMIKRWLAK